MNKDLDIIFGIRATKEAIESGSTIEKIYLQKGPTQSKLFEELQLVIKEKNIPVSYVPIEKLNRLSKNGNHQGVVAKISPLSFYNLENVLEKITNTTSTPFILILDQVSDVRNFGAMIRTAECVGVDTIIVQQSGNAPINGETIKTSAGAAFKIPICRVNHIKDALFLLQSYNIQLVAATEKTDHTIYDVDLTKATAIIMGSEHKGVNPSVLKMVDQKAKLPLLGTTESLNVSVACGAILYEAIRQRLV